MYLSSIINYLIISPFKNKKELCFKIKPNIMKILTYIFVLFLALTSFNCSKNRIIISENKITNDIFYLDGEVKPFSGICIVPQEDGKTVKEVRRFRNGIIDGEAISYFPDGKLKRRGEYKNGKMDGLWQQWNVNGIMEFQANYKNDMMSGYSEEWYKNGNMKEEGEYNNNERTGTWKFYNESGDFIYEKQYSGNKISLNKSDQSPYI